MAYDGIIKEAQIQLAKNVGKAMSKNVGKKFQTDIATGEITPEEIEASLLAPINIPQSFPVPKVDPEQTLFGIPESKAMGGAGAAILALLALGKGGSKIKDIAGALK